MRSVEAWRGSGDATGRLPEGVVALCMLRGRLGRPQPRWLVRAPGRDSDHERGGPPQEEQEAEASQDEQHREGFLEPSGRLMLRDARGIPRQLLGSSLGPRLGGDGAVHPFMGIKLHTLSSIRHASSIQPRGEVHSPPPRRTLKTIRTTQLCNMHAAVSCYKFVSVASCASSSVLRRESIDPRVGRSPTRLLTASRARRCFAGPILREVSHTEPISKRCRQEPQPNEPRTTQQSAPRCDAGRDGP